MLLKKYEAPEGGCPTSSKGDDMPKFFGIIWSPSGVEGQMVHATNEGDNDGRPWEGNYGISGDVLEAT